MSVSILAILGLVAAIIAVLLLARPVKLYSTATLTRRFGPEYDRVVALAGGDVRAAERELADRLRCFGGLCPFSLTDTTRQQYLSRWSGLQEQFVDAPGTAAARANQLLSRLACDRGLTAESRERQLDALSVHFPRHIDGARLLHAAAQQAAAGVTDADEMRRAMVAGRAHLEELLADQGPRVPSGSAAGRRSGARHALRLPSQRTIHSTHL
ncbi:hypothetical protein [Streptomyces sp. NBC_00467]|uniref:hypothetical protein n=1 Tax=Streptomyces sp. NBC_00467 TaxID=2975752 RepID=UPI002E17B504